ncbi:MAG: hypothetical protein JW996_02430 [Candidatus Cloacimonetes bacterium]|nr:hypothetical protein [Candidatus Cloacimonadota bacterium]
MKITTAKILILVAIILVVGSLLFAKAAVDTYPDKQLDLSKWHNVGNIWLRISNYGFFGSGGDGNPLWPSLEYPGGSGIDYLYRGALWFGAKKVRRDNFGRRLYWLSWPTTDPTNIVAEGDVGNGWVPGLQMVVDTLVSEGFDGDQDLKEFLPAYNPLETAALGTQYSEYNGRDVVVSQSIRSQRRGMDDDGDGWIDEDPVGFAFPFRDAEELPAEFSAFGGQYLHDMDPDDFSVVSENINIWYPLGFVNLAEDPTNDKFNLAQPNNDDDDTLTDEDGSPVSEQDYISYYYDYSPFGTAGERDWGNSKDQSKHYPLNVMVRQMSYQWSYEHIKNLVYVEFNITNMNPLDTLFDCAMGIYMDSDCGPQAWGGTTIAGDDVSSYVAGEGYEFAYSYDFDGDSGLTMGYVGSRVCTPDPEQLEFACWTWDVGDGPDDTDPLDLTPTGPTANQQYWLLTDRNPDDTKYTSLRNFPNAQITTPLDTRYLFGFYGDMQGLTNPSVNSWNLPPGRTMKIVIAVFPGDDLLDLKVQSLWAKQIYGQAQTLDTVVLPDTFVHYVGPEPPYFPSMYAETDADGDEFYIYWDNESEINNEDVTVVDQGYIGWQDFDPSLDSHISNYDPDIYPVDIPSVYPPDPSAYDENAIVNPWTGYRLRHDFQGYTLWGRSQSGSQEDWVKIEMWDRIETEQDFVDYSVNYGTSSFLDFGGTDLGYDKGLPNVGIVEAGSEDLNYYRFDDLYNLVPYQVGDVIYGHPIFDASVVYSSELADMAANLTFDEQLLLFKHPNISEDVYLGLIYSHVSKPLDKMIPLAGHGGAAYIGEDGMEIDSHRRERLSRRYYSSVITNPPKGKEYYIAVTAWDRGMPSIPLGSLQSGRDIDANMKILFPGPAAASDMDNIYVVPNPYVGQSTFDGRRDYDEKGDKSRRLWFVNLPEKCTVKIFTLAGDLVDKFKHDGSHEEDIITVSKAWHKGLAASGIHAWDLLSQNNQIIAPGVYLYSVKDDDGDIKVGKFVIIK